MTRTPDDIALDLMFRVNGTLVGAEAADIDALLAEDAALRSEFEALSALRASMQAEQMQAPGEFGLARLMRDVDRTPAVATKSPSRTWVWQLAAAVAMVALVGQSVWMRGDGTQAGYQLASAGSSADLVVAFAPNASEAQIRDILLAQGVEIVAGPSALGLYDLKVLAGGDLAQVVAALRGETNIIESVEDATQ